MPLLFFRIQAYINYLFKSQSKLWIHSPFIFEFYGNILESTPDKNDPFVQKVESLRKQYLQNDKIVALKDYGTGSSVGTNERKISSIAKHSLKPLQQCFLLKSIAESYQCKVIYELGTCLGISTSYLASGSQSPTVYTFEGDPNLLKLAKNTWQKLQLPNIHGTLGNIDHTLIQSLKVDNSTLDLVFFDANHQYQATLDYFEYCLNYSTDRSIFVFDDIHWSQGMQKAWEKIKKHPKVQVTIDLFYFGIVFFRTTQAKQHFILR